MSRTTRKRVKSYEQYYGGWCSNYAWDKGRNLRKRRLFTWRDTESSIIGFVDYGWESYADDKALYYSDNYDQGYFRRNLPKSYRKLVNRKRKNRDKRELWKEVHWEEYDGLYSKWNGVDSDPCWYW